jgi:uncharacterized protein (DUF1697 family)
MTTFIALLRGVNVGRAKRVPMSEFRTLLAGLGYTGVATLLNSGNAVFRATSGAGSQHATDIARAIARSLKVEVPVIVKSAKDLAAIQPPEQFSIGHHAAYLHCADGILESKAARALLGKAGRAASTRNLATTLKLLALSEKAR